MVGECKIRFYAGAPLRTPNGHNIGSLCLIDDQPRSEFTPRQRHTLKEFAQIVMREMELWKDKVIMVFIQSTAHDVESYADTIEIKRKDTDLDGEVHQGVLGN